MPKTTAANLPPPPLFRPGQVYLYLLFRAKPNEGLKLPVAANGARQPPAPRHDCGARITEHFLAAGIHALHSRRQKINRSAHWLRRNADDSLPDALHKA